MSPYDSNNPVNNFNFKRRQCGVDADVKNKPYLYFVTPFLNSLNRTVCTSECPSVYSLDPSDG